MSALSLAIAFMVGAIMLLTYPLLTLFILCGWIFQKFLAKLLIEG